jgi:hypothetical protein
MSERGQCPDDCESCNFDYLTRSCLLPARTLFWLLLRFHVYGRSVMSSKRLVNSPKSLLTNKFRLPFHRLWFLIRSDVKITLHERVFLTANPNENLISCHSWLNTQLSIMAILTHHITSDKVGKSNERTTSWRFSDDCAIKSNGD